MTTALTFTFSILAAIVPGFVISPQNPGTILGFAVVGTCVFFTLRDYVRKPERLSRTRPDV